jgi:hypothetical protein
MNCCIKSERPAALIWVAYFACQHPPHRRIMPTRSGHGEYFYRS